MVARLHMRGRSVRLMTSLGLMTSGAIVVLVFALYTIRSPTTCNWKDNVSMTTTPRSLASSECLHNFLASIEPTVDFERFCDSSWNQSDIICKQFFLQNGLDIKDNCLLSATNKLVPKFVYYVIFSEKPGEPPLFLFMHYLSIVSARKFINPWAIYVISDAPPRGYWWTRVLSDVTGVRYVFRPTPSLTKGKLQFIQHASDVVRLQTLIVNGGIYLDTDMIILNPIDELLDSSLSMGFVDEATGLGNAFIVSERNSAFVKEWYEGYRHFNNTHMFENSLWTAMRLWRRDKSKVNEIGDKIYRPNWFESNKLLKEVGYEWSGQYGVHVWHRHGHIPENPAEIYNLNTTLGEIFRSIYYGETGLRTKE